MAQRIDLSPQESAKAAWIAIAQNASVLENQIDMFVLLHGLRLGQHSQAAGHAQMHDQRAVCEVEQQIFGAARESAQFVALQPFGQIGRNRPAQIGCAHDDLRDGGVGQMGGDAAAGGFDFW